MQDNAPAAQLAYLNDRIRFNEGKTQRYGTVLDGDANGNLGCELVFPEQIDQFRAEVDLPPFSKTLDQHQYELAAEGVTPPQNLHNYREA